MLTKHWLIIIVVLLATSSAGAAPARRTLTPIVHPTVMIYSAGPGSSLGAFPLEMGLNGREGDAITSAPGVLSIVPGERWSNFVTAAREGVPYVIKSVVLTMISGPDWLFELPARMVTQAGDANIRLWWPLLYESPGTTWTLTVLYGTTAAWDSDGSGPNPAAHVHTEVWTWQLGRTQESLGHLLAVFRQMPFGRSQTPLISDEALYRELRRLLDSMTLPPNFECIYPHEGLPAIGDFEMLVMDACIAATPAYPSPTGPGTGIAITDENPVVIRLFQDIERLGCMVYP